MTKTAPLSHNGHAGEGTLNLDADVDTDESLLLEYLHGVRSPTIDIDWPDDGEPEYLEMEVPRV